MPHLLDGIEQIRHDARRHLRKEKGHTRNLSVGGRKMRVWIDAICINQVDNVEKDAQIALMTQIYSKAERTLVWLGAPADGSHLVIPEIPSFTQKLFDWGKRLYPKDFALAGLPPFNEPFWQHLADFCSRL